MTARPSTTAPARRRIPRLPLAAAGRQATAWWGTRTARERALLSAALAIGVAALTWTQAVQPALHAIAQARERLPRLHADAARVDALVAEARALQQAESGRTDAASLPDALRASLQRAGLEASATVGATPGTDGDPPRYWDIELHNADVARVMKWLAQLPYLLHVQTQAVELARASIDGRDRPGSVTGRIRVSLPAERDR